MNDQVQAELKKIFNGRFSTSVSTRTNYARGEDTYDPIRLCNENKIPVVPFGTGTSLEGNVVGNEKGITISLEKMNKILSVNAEDLNILERTVSFFQLIQVLMQRSEVWLQHRLQEQWRLNMVL